MVTADGDWKVLWNADKTVFENYTLTQAEDEKFSKHESSYAAVGLCLFSFQVLFWAVLVVTGYWLSGGDISVRFGFSGTSTA